MIDTWEDYVDAGFRIFGLHGVTDGKCDCGNPDCEALYKHPIVRGWQNTPDWSDEQLETMQMAGHFDTGFGVLCAGWLIVDVDARNGGVESYQKLLDKIPEIGGSGFIVETGSGGGSKHVYFKAPEGVAFVQHVEGYPGVDIKTSGYVVGSGSLHVSGRNYTTVVGSPSDVTDAPQALIDLVKKPERTRAIIGDQFVDVSLQEIKEMLQHYPNDDLHYDEWIAVGMAINHSTGGSQEGYALWVDWSATSSKYDPGSMDKKWHSFGKCAEPVTLGTIFYHAQKNGYVQPVTFNLPEVEKIESFEPAELPFDTGHIDLRRPPGFAGKLTAWMNENAYSPRTKITAAASLVAIGNIGMHYRDDLTGTTPNLMVLCAAGTGTGKEVVNSSFSQIMGAAGMQTAIHGDIKSKQEIIRNLIEHQIAAYCTDEIGEVLKTIENAKKKGGAPYLEGITGEIMKIFTKADGTLLVSGDVRRDLMSELIKKQSGLIKMLDEGKGIQSINEQKLQSVEKFIRMIETEGGIPKPFLSMVGFTTADSLEPALSVDMAKNGFLNRSFLIQEQDNNPRKKWRLKTTPFPYADHVRNIAFSHGHSRDPGARVECYGMEKIVRTEPPAVDLLKMLFDWEHAFGEYHQEHTGYESLVRRAYEFISKVSLILAIGDNGIRTVEHVKWAAAFVKNDIDDKIRMIQHVESQGSKDEQVVVTGIKERLISICSDDSGYYESQAINRVKRRDVTRENVVQLIDSMIQKGLLWRKGRKLYSFDPKQL